MLKRLLLLALLFVPTTALAAPTSWDFASGILQPLQSQWSALIKGDRFQATSTTASSTLPLLETTQLKIGTLTGILKGVSGFVTTATPGSDYQAPITLTTTGSSGAATFIANVLNIPQYSGGGGDTNWQLSNGALTPTTTIPVFIGTTTKPFFFVNGDLGGAATSTNDFADFLVSNTSTGACATAEFDAQSNSSSLTNFFSAFGHTGSGFTGSGCANTPYTDFGSNSTYIINPNGNVNFGLGTTSSSARFAWYGAGYGNTNRLMTLTQPGYIGLGTNSPDSPITISSVGATTAIITPQAGTMIHLASSGAQNARITGDVYTNGTAQGFVFQGRKSRGGVGSPTAVNADDTLALLGGVGYGTTGFPAISAGAYAIRAEASGTDTSQPTYLALLTTTTGTITPLERMRVTSTGRVGIGTTSPYAKLSVVGQVVASHFTATTTTANTFPQASTTLLTVGTLNGPLQANNGYVTATTSVGAQYGGTGQTTYTVGDILYADTTTSLARLPAVATQQVLTSTGVGSAPAYSGAVILSTSLVSPIMTSNNNSSLSNFRVSSASSIAAQLNNAAMQLNGSTNMQQRVLQNGSTATALAAGASLAQFLIGAQTATEGASGTHDLIANVGIAAPVVTNGAGATTNASTFYIDGAPSGTFTPVNNYAMWVNAGISRFDDAVGIGTTTPFSQLSVSTTTQSSPNTSLFAVASTTHATLFNVLGNGNVGVGTTTPGTIFSIGDTTNAINLNNTATSTFSFGLKAPNLFITSITETARLIISGIAAAFSPTVAGECGIDTTDNQWKCFSSGAVRVYPSAIDSAFLYATSTMGTGTTTIKVSGFKGATTFGSIGCINGGTGTFVMQQGDGTASSTAVKSAPGLTTTFTTISANNAFTSGEAVMYAIGSVSGTVVDPSCSYQRAVDAT